MFILDNISILRVWRKDIWGLLTLVILPENRPKIRSELSALLYRLKGKNYAHAVQGWDFPAGSRRLRITTMTAGTALKSQPASLSL